jgi:hypothetical protein
MGFGPFRKVYCLRIPGPLPSLLENMELGKIGNKVLSPYGTIGCGNPESGMRFQMDERLLGRSLNRRGCGEGDRVYP